MAEDTEGHGAAADGAVDAAHGGAEAVGMPQLDFSTFPNQIFWLVVTLGALYYLMTRIALPRIADVLAERQGTITNDIAAAEELKLQAQEAEKAYEKALADARAEAQRIAQETRDEIQKDLDKATLEADASIAERAAESETRIAQIREGARGSVEEVARETAAAIVASFGVQPDDEAAKGAVSERMKG